MEPTQRFWVITLLGSASAVLAILFTDGLLLAVPLGIGAWVLIEQLVFTQSLSGLTETSPITQSLTRETVLTDETSTLSVQLTEDATTLTELKARLTVAANPAVTFQTEREYDLTDAGQLISLPVRVTVAGTYEINAPTVQLTSRRGLFRETLKLGNPCSITGEPRVPRDIHIGTGGERIAVTDGEHDAEQGSAGFEPGELREYLPGDPTNRIDWKATARLGDPYVRDFDAETTRQTHLVVDRRPVMLGGIDGETKLDYAREIGIWVAEYVASLDDPLSATLIDDEGATEPTQPDSSTTQYQRIRRELLNLTTVTSKSQGAHRHRPSRYAEHSRREGRRAGSELDGDDAFSQTLRPYYQSVDAYIQQVTDDPLFKSVQTRLTEYSGDAWLVIVTDDTNRGELLETARAAATPTTFVSLFILPTVLFETQEFTDLEQSYQEYQDFESFRQQLAAIPNVTAFEVGPRDRLAALLETANTRRAE